jgi:hypothetical protein
MTEQNQDTDGGRVKQFWITWRGWVVLTEKCRPLWYLMISPNSSKGLSILSDGS